MNYSIVKKRGKGGHPQTYIRTDKTRQVRMSGNGSLLDEGGGDEDFANALLSTTTPQIPFQFMPGCGEISDVSAYR